MGPPHLIDLPGYFMLANEFVQKELQLTQGQRTGLQEIADTLGKTTRAIGNVANVAPTDTVETLTQRAQEETEELKLAGRKKIENLLTPQQLKALKNIIFHEMGSMMLNNPGVLKLVGATDEQKRDLQRLRETINRAMQRQSQVELDGALAVLDAKELQDLRPRQSDSITRHVRQRPQISARRGPDQWR